MIYTFYSFKGGVGRSMALANVAELLYQAGLRVLIVDWDLEAPSLESFFPLSREKALGQPGIIDMLSDFKQQLVKPTTPGAKPEEIPVPLPNIRDYIFEIYAGQRGKGVLSLMSAGRRAGEYLAHYISSINAFDWEDFYDNWEGEVFIEWLRRQLNDKDTADVVLVDSRTGFTEMGGICTYQLADVVVMFCAANHPSLEGIYEMARSFSLPSIERLRKNRPLSLLIVPARVEDRAETALLAQFQREFEEQFAQFVPTSMKGDAETFWQMKIPHIPYYAFNEMVAVRESDVARTDDMVRAFATLVREMAKLAPPDSPIRRVLRQQRKYPYDVFLSYSNTDKADVEFLARRLQGVGLEPFLAEWHLLPGQPLQAGLAVALEESRTCAVLLGPRGLGMWQSAELATIVEKTKRSPDFHLIPVLLPGAQLPEQGQLPAFLARLTWVDFRQDLKDDDAFYRLVGGIKGVAAGQGLEAKSPRAEITPYRGLQPFTEEYARFFFGREALVQRLLEALRRNRFLAVIGPAGSGKSSLVRAGLLPQLRQGALSGSETWVIVTMQPGAHPTQELASCLAPFLPGEESRTESMARLHEHLRTDQQALHRTAAIILAKQEPRARLFLVIDQFEELFTLCQEEAERQHFLDNLLQAATLPQGRTVVLLVLRADYYADAAAYAKLAEQIADHQLLVTPMTASELRQAIEAPVQQVGLTLEAGLVDTMLADVADEPGALPLLQFALLEIWQRRQGRQLTLATYREIGGIGGAIARRAEDVYNGLTPSEQAIARRILLRLVQPGEGTEDARRRAYLSELTTDSQQTTDVAAVLQRLTDARLVTTSIDPTNGQTTVDLAHEALIQRWPRLRSWIDEDRAALHMQRRLAAAVQEWESQQRNESYLYGGARLAEAVEWARAYPDAVNVNERLFLEASQLLSEREAEEQEAMRQRELAAAQALAAEERRVAVRLRRMAVLTTIIGVITVGLAILAGWFGVQSRQSLQAAQDAQAVAEASQNVAERQTRRAQAGELSIHAQNALVDYPNDPSLALILARDAVSITYQTDGYVTVNAAKAALAAVAAAPPWRHTLVGHQGPVNTAAYSPDGKTIVTASDDQTVRLWDVATGQEIRQLVGHKAGVSTAAFSPDGKTIVTASDDQTVRLWDATTGQSVMLLQAGAGVSTAAFSPDGKTIIMTSDDQTVRLWDAVTGQLVMQWPSDAGARSATFSPDGKYIVTASDDQTARLWEVATGKELRQFSGHTGPIWSAAFSPDGKNIVTASDDQTIRVWDAATGSELHKLSGHTAPVWSAVYSPNGRTIVTASDDQTVRVWDTQSGQELLRLLGHTAGVRSARYSPDGTRIVSASSDQTVREWKAQRSQETLQVLGHATAIKTAVYSPDGRRIVTAGSVPVAKVWDAENGQALLLLQGHTAGLRAAVFSPDGQTIVTASDDQTAIIWDGESGRKRLSLRGHTAGLRAATFSPDGQTIVTASDDQTAIIWEVTTGKKLRLFNGHTGPVLSAVYSPDGQTIVTASEDKTVRIWDVTTGQEVHQFGGHAGAVWSAAYSPDGQTIVSASDDQTAIIWDATTGQQLRVLNGHTGTVWSAAYSPDGQHIVTAGDDRTVRIWQAQNGQEVMQLQGHTGPVNAAAYRPDGSRIITASEDSTVRVWPATPAHLLTMVESLIQRSPPELTPEERRRYGLG